MAKKPAPKKPGMSKKSQPKSDKKNDNYAPLADQGGWTTTQQNSKYVQKDIYNDVITPGY